MLVDAGKKPALIHGVDGQSHKAEDYLMPELHVPVRTTESRTRLFNRFFSTRLVGQMQPVLN
jgi:hypothetical protein